MIETESQKMKAGTATKPCAQRALLRDHTCSLLKLQTSPRRTTSGLRDRHMRLSRRNGSGNMGIRVTILISKQSRFHMGLGTFRFVSRFGFYTKRPRCFESETRETTRPPPELKRLDWVYGISLFTWGSGWLENKIFFVDRCPSSKAVVVNLMMMVQVYIQHRCLDPLWMG
ncbi:hypothetical protein FALCPG4_013605 [Fusarium falciforme]